MAKGMAVLGYGLKATMLLIIASAILDEVEGISMSKHSTSDIRKTLERFNQNAVRSIQSEDGDIIDCIDIYMQPAFRHPALKNHTIQMKPSYRYEHMTAKKQNSTFTASQLWKRSGSCPKGTIPIRRIKRQELFRADSLDRFGRKNPIVVKDFKRKEYQYTDPTNGSNRIRQMEDVYFQQENHSTALIVTGGFSYSGAKADLNVWNPAVESDDEFTSAQIWVINGPWYQFESVEAGWIVNPSVYGDRRTRLFAYWTADGSKETGCFDLICSGFVQTSDQIALGSAIDPVSYPGQYQYQITLFIHKDFGTNNWWLQYGGDVEIGYWPGELFNTLCHQASLVKWGGQVYSSKIGKAPHTATDMGSGDTVRRYGYGCYIRQIRVRENGLDLKYPEWTETIMDEWRCYRAFLRWEYMTDPEFYFGGPGQSDLCP